MKIRHMHKPGMVNPIFQCIRFYFLAPTDIVELHIFFTVDFRQETEVHKMKPTKLGIKC